MVWLGIAPIRYRYDSRLADIDVANDPRWVTPDDGVTRDRSRHDGTGSHHGPLPDREARKDGCICPDRCAVADPRLEKLFGILLTPRKTVIGKGGVRADENIVLDADSVPELHATFNRDPVSDYDVVFDENMVANIAVRANPGARQHMGKCPHPRPFADCCRLAKGVWMNEQGHYSPPETMFSERKTT